MKIALVREKYTDFGGAERYLANLAEHLLLSGHEVHIFAHEWNSRNTEGTKCSRFHVHKVPVVMGLSVLRVISFAVNVRRLLKRERFDIIHSFERTLCQDVYRAGDGCHREWLLQRRLIDPWYKTISIRLNPLHMALLAIERRIFTEGNYRMIIANSKRGKEEIMHHYGVPSERIKVIYNAVDTDRYALHDPEGDRADMRRSLAIPLHDRVLLFVGSGFRRKGLRATMQALVELDSTIRLIVVGKDRLRPYRKLAEALGIEDRMHFTGPVVQTERYYNASDLFVFPTIYEPFSNVCLEAMAAGLPVVTSKINGASEAILEGENGFIVENPVDAHEIAGKIRKGLQLDRASVRTCNSALLEQFSWKRHMEALSLLYEGLMREDGRHV
ncbi:MAG TPA: glycosyltransferase family 4 protein [Syntrophales bacterium]|nr:glycosyltransferase family 4 protein [Syntrophales bacterium]HPQ43062.1 glycosyltransferase family 4 protein [Syntrophales bacterium]